MVSLGSVVCKTIGVAGMGMALYDGVNVSKAMARKQAQYVTANWLENAYYDSRTLDHISSSSNAMRKKVFDLRTANPIPPLVGKVKGGVKGFFYGLGVNLPAILCGSIAILAKGTMAKLGAAGVALSVLYKIARDGFGLGKQHPMN